VNRALYLMLWFLEIVAILGLVLAIALPIQDYALREFIAWQQHPSPETYTTYLEKRRQQNAGRLMFAALSAVTATLLARPLRKYRRKLR